MRLQDAVVVIVGASGGLGSAVAREAVARGARVVLAARDGAKLAALAAALAPAAHAHPVDLADAASVVALRDAALARYERIDYVINAAGYDVRKPLGDHTPEEIGRLLDINLRGAVLLTQTFLPALTSQGAGGIVHVGGFADGRMAFPYYSVDVATRAGLAAFIESVNRELNSRTVVVSYFSPAPADTPAERPFHPIWRAMGLRIETPERVAHALLASMLKRRRLAMMGGVATRVFAALNAVAPRAADALLLNRYRRVLRSFLAPTAAATPENTPPVPAQRPRALLWLGWGLIALSILLYAGLLAIPLLGLAAGASAGVATGLIVAGEATFWIGGLLVGAQVVARFRRWLNPRVWWNALCGR